MEWGKKRNHAGVCSVGVSFWTTLLAWTAGGRRRIIHVLQFQKSHFGCRPSHQPLRSISYEIDDLWLALHIEEVSWWFVFFHFNISSDIPTLIGIATTISWFQLHTNILLNSNYSNVIKWSITPAYYLYSRQKNNFKYFLMIKFWFVFCIIQFGFEP